MRYLLEIMHWGSLLAAGLVAYRLFRDLSSAWRQEVAAPRRAETLAQAGRLGLLCTAYWLIALGCLAVYGAGQPVAFAAATLPVGAMLAAGLAGARAPRRSVTSGPS